MLSKSKTVGYFAGFALLFNQMTGPGVPFTATNFQTPGLLMTLLSYVIFCMVSGFSMLFLIQAMQAIPGNSQFQGHVEYSTLLNFYFGHSMHIFGQLVLYCALQSNAIQSLNLIAQSVDYLLVDSIGRSCGLTMGFKWMCVNVPSQEYASPFGDVYMLFTYGFLITLLIAIPFAFYDLDSSATITVISFGLTVIMGLQWISAAGLNGFEWDRVPVVQPVGPTYGQVMGTVMLNLACCTVIPSWINIKNKDVPAQDVIWTSIFMTSFYYICIGFFLAMGFDIDASGNVLNAILTQGVPALLCKITVGMFSIVMLLPGIPISFLVSRNNLVQNKITSPLIATLLAFVVPFFVCIPLQTGYNLIKFQTWTSLTVVSACNFVFPFLLYFKCRSFRKAFNRDRSNCTDSSVDKASAGSAV
ncbi:hypothetical protein EDD86DRAFT_189807 [Gorgonomyces haynaldii]|nr:hypothetical protein EDD86DRAFT_189807 [Gorgonomyces haynaldii]